jgi:hypothetical protein
MNELQALNSSEQAFPMQPLDSKMGVEANALTARILGELQAGIILAKQYPRNILQAEQKIKVGVQRYSLAEKAEYSLPIGGKPVTGPSIHLIQHIARCYGNIDMGVRDLAKGEDAEGQFTSCEAFAWDKEDNIRTTRAFSVYHFITVNDYDSKVKGAKKKKYLSDQGEISRLIAAQASRHLRGCLQRVLPADLVDLALIEAKKTLQKGEGAIPLIDRCKALVVWFQGFGIEQQHLEDEAKVKMEFWTESIHADLRGRGVSLKDGEATREALFPLMFKGSPELSGGSAKAVSDLLRAKGDAK